MFRGVWAPEHDDFGLGLETGVNLRAAMGRG